MTAQLVWASLKTGPDGSVTYVPKYVEAPPEPPKPIDWQQVYAEHVTRCTQSSCCFEEEWKAHQ